ncbi:hypothetical protein KY358_02740 [Candidatus Woesearchaeota archaeon]|nr:hypothetical protein [Candidatus Woesearchaeota archaeon]
MIEGEHYYALNMNYEGLGLDSKYPVDIDLAATGKVDVFILNDMDKIRYFFEFSQDVASYKELGTSKTSIKAQAAQDSCLLIINRNTDALYVDYHLTYN